MFVHKGTNVLVDNLKQLVQLAASVAQELAAAKFVNQAALQPALEAFPASHAALEHILVVKGL